MPRPPRLLSLLITLAFAAPCALASTVYQWKDADGGMHFTDTPPPPGAVLIKGPKPKPGSTPPQASAAAVAPEPQPAPTLSPEEAAYLADIEARMAEAKARTCRELAFELDAARRLLDGRSKEIISAEERATLPAEIADMEARRLRDCPSP